ncbi:MAG: SDR family NAD(P)-dependent oxidoreductase [Endomicrobium sp.]|jgi:nucleoside-diphosphate-sugar epimerase|nr:SDR family NAD(P)-dependent oxidoreductase [Endomicrobium sp.]
MLKILVTGANGFLGSHIVEALIEASHHVVCCVRKTSNLKWIKKMPVKYMYGDLNDISFLKTIIDKMDVVIHCAGIVRAVDKYDYFKTNVEITKKLCKVVLDVNPNLKKIVFISSQAAMGPAKSINDVKNTNKENHPISDYGLSKLVAEMEIKRIFYEKVPYTILRPAAIYGPRDKDMLVLFKLIHRHLRPTIMTKRLLQLVYVRDVANTVVLCLNSKKTDNKIYYIANSDIYTWSDLFKSISDYICVKTIPIPIPDFIFKLVGMGSDFLSCVTNKAILLNSQKINEILQNCWIADTELTKIDLDIKFTSLEVASKITYNWCLNTDFGERLNEY